MKFGTVRGRLVLVADGSYVDVALASNGRFPTEPLHALTMWDELRDWADRLTGLDDILDEQDLGPVIEHPGQVFAVGLNYAGHAREGGVEPPTHPMIFTKYPSSITGPYSNIELPSRKVDWEVELVVVMGTGGYRIPSTDAWQHVAGVTVGQDISEREVQNRKPAPQFSLGKSFPGFSPIGPLLVTPDELGDPDRLDIRCRLNGEVVQDSATSDLIFSVSELIGYISHIVPMSPGDLIFTGTPAGVGQSRKPARFLCPGDVLESTIDGIGTMVNTMTAAANPI